jgi:hypothetical protein
VTGILKKNEKTGFFHKKYEKSHNLCEKLRNRERIPFRLNFHLHPEEIGTTADKQIIGTFSFAYIPLKTGTSKDDRAALRFIF